MNLEYQNYIQGDSNKHETWWSIDNCESASFGFNRVGTFTIEVI